GKTTLVKSLANPSEKVVYLDLELPSDRAILRNPELFFKENMDKIIILDEIQLAPDLFPVMRSIIDIRRKPGKFIVTGSASPALLKQGSETLAGRIIFNELHPFSPVETG
ncbi:MAG TPA: AAA family ATPase, partial [Cyclobacteriaceae bacterium]|nr:AAA family ATPase [Cyclobacteriaceae bacterium]